MAFLIIISIIIIIFILMLLEEYKKSNDKTEDNNEPPSYQKISPTALERQSNIYKTNDVDTVIQQGRSYFDYTYEELLQTQSWKEKRLKILNRDNYTCTFCHKQKPVMVVHHKYYLKYPNEQHVLPWDYPDDALITLCDDCHKWWHANNKVKVYHKKFK